jgi:hypothetical protein
MWFMIGARPLASVAGVFIDDIAQRLTAHISPPVVEEEIQFPLPEPPWRDWRHVRRHERCSKLP